MCIDPSNENSNVEGTEGNMYDVIFVYGAQLSPYNPCEGCSYVDGGGDAASCVADSNSCATADGKACYVDPPCACDGVGAGAPNSVFVGFASSCVPSGEICAAAGGMFGCFVGDELCLPAP